MRFLTVLAICLGLASPAAAQRYWGEEQIPFCSDTTPEVCRPEVLALLLRKLQAPTAESLAADGFVGVRVMGYDAFRTLWPMTSFLSRPMTDHRRNGVAEARIIHADGHVAVLTRPAWEIGWRDVDHIVTSLVEHPPSEAPPQRDPGAPPVLQTCLHPPTVIIEVVKDGRVHRWWPYGDCRRDPAVAEALEVAEIVAAAFPHCAYFPVDRFGMGTGRLRACLMADGPEPLAAVEVLEDLQPGVSGDARAVYEADRQSERVRMLTLDGRRVEGRDEVVAALKAGALGNRWLRVLRATGEAGRVTVHGQLNQVEPGVDPDSLNVAVVFSKEGDGEWRITEWRPEQRLP